MGIFETLQLQEISRQRKLTIDREGTAPLSFLNTGDIAVDTSQGGNVIDFEAESLTSKYTPFDLVEINNTSTSGLNVYINQNLNWKKVVRAGTIMAIKDFKGVRSIRISKRDNTVTIAAGEVETSVMRQSLSDDEFRRRQITAPLPMKLLNKFLGV